MANVRFLCMILAIVCFLLAALNVATPRGNLMAAGLFFWALAVTISGS